MKKNALIIIICIIIVVIIAAIAGGVSYAIWKERRAKEAAVQPEQNADPSYRFQLYHALDSAGNLVYYNPYDKSTHGSIVRKSRTDKNVDLYGEVRYHYSKLDYILSTTGPFYVRTDAHLYSSADGYVYLSPETTTGVILYVYKNKSYQALGEETDAYGFSQKLYVLINWFRSTYSDRYEVEEAYLEVEYDPDDDYSVRIKESEIDDIMSQPRFLSFDVEESVIRSEKGKLFCIDDTGGVITSDNKQVLHQESVSGEYVAADSADVIRGTDLYVADYEEYNIGDPDDEEEYGVVQYRQTTSNGTYLYNKVGEDSYVDASLDLIALRDSLLYSEDGETYTAATNAQMQETPEMIFYGETDQQASTQDISKALCVYAGYPISSYALVGYTSTAVAEVVVPATIVSESNGLAYPVTKVCATDETAEYAFYRNNIITAIMLPDTVVEIAAVTFGDMMSLHDIYFLAEGRVTIGKYAFLNCERLTNIYLMPGTRLYDEYGNEITYESDVFTGCTSLTASSFKDFTTNEIITGE